MTTTSRRAVLLAGLAAPFAAHAETPTSTVLAKAMEGTATPGMAALLLRDFKARPELVAGSAAWAAPPSCAPETAGTWAPTARP